MDENREPIVMANSFLPNNKKKIIISILVVLILAVGVYFLIPTIKIYIQKFKDNRIQKQDIEIGKRLQTEIIPMSEKEKSDVAKELDAQSEKIPSLTPEKNKELVQFLNS